MRTLIALLPGLGCAAGMVVCMKMMAGGRRDHDAGRDGAEHTEDVAVLRTELQRLRLQLAERTSDPGERTYRPSDEGEPTRSPGSR